MFDKGRNIWFFSCSVHSMYSLIIGFLYKHSPGPSISYFRLLKYLFYCFQFLPGSNHTGKTPWGEKITRKHNSAPPEICKKNTTVRLQKPVKNTTVRLQKPVKNKTVHLQKSATVHLQKSVKKRHSTSDEQSE